MRGKIENHKFFYKRAKEKKKNWKTYIYKLELKTNKNFKKEKQTKIKNQN
jgi:hypothetical protein